MTSPFDFQLPPDASEDLRAIVLLGQGLDDLRAIVTDLAANQQRLHQHLTSRRASGQPWADDDAPTGPIRWDTLDRHQASTIWIWLITWVTHLVGRYQLDEEIPACWPQHPPLVEELTALASAWQASYTPDATAEAPLRWHESLARTRARLREWDDATRCRHGTHHPHHIEQPWPPSWRDTALDTALADVATRPTPTPVDGDHQTGGEPQ
jgi:hypothetical protein